MTAAPEVPAAVDVDGRWAGLVTSSAEFLAGLLAHGLLASVGRPEKLPQDVWPQVPAELVQEVFQLGVAAGLHAGRVSRDAGLHRDQMLRVQEQFEAIGFAAMAGLVSRSRRLMSPHPADGEMARGRNSGVTSSTSDTGEGV